jgi:hypothetical protein
MQMTTARYAQLREVSTVAVTRACAAGKKLVGVTSYSKQGRDWILNVNPTEAGKKPKKYLVIQK